MTRLIINGARGRMGSRLVALAGDDKRFSVVAAVDIDTPSGDRPSARGAADVLIDFSSPGGAQHACAIALACNCALFVGTTGLPDAALECLQEASAKIPVMVAANTSLGVAVLNHMAAAAARVLGREFDIDIIETHHSAKKDAPSGTALRISRALLDGAGISLPADRIHAIRAGDVIGEHTLVFSGRGERLSITHSATSRDLFVLGALRAAAWLAGKPPGLYTINQALGI